MKKIISILFALQLFVFVFYGVFILRYEMFREIILPREIIQMQVNFYDNQDHFNSFVEAAYETEMFITHIPLYESIGNTYHLQTTDVTLNGEMVLVSGRLPEYGTTEFIHSIDTGNENQVGIIDDILPGLQLSVTHLSNPANTQRDGVYVFYTDAFEAVQEFKDAIIPYTRDIELHYLDFTIDDFWITLELMIGSVGSGAQSLAEVLIPVYTLFLIMILVMIQYGVKLLRTQSILKLNGFSIWKILQKVTISSAISLFIGMIIAYAVSLIYIYASRFHLFLGDITFYFIMIGLAFIVLYLLIINLFVYTYLTLSKEISLIKGKKSVFISQFINVLNHGLKIGISFLFLFSSLTILDNMNRLNQRLSAQDRWNETENIYQPASLLMGTNTFETESLLFKPHRLLYDYLVENHHAFIVSAENMPRILDDGTSPFADPDLAPPLEIAPNGWRITISPSYLDVNPIQAIGDIDIKEALIWDDYTWNLLVPISLEEQEEELTELYLEEFYSQKVLLANMYNDELGKPLIETTIDELSINIIYVYNDQDFFTFDIFRPISTSGIVNNTVAVIFNPDTFHAHFLSYLFQQNVFIINESAEDTRSMILPAIEANGLESNIPAVHSVYEQFNILLQALIDEFIRLFIFTAFLVGFNLTISYYLIASYFETNKFQLVIKRNFGYHILKRNKKFLLTFLSYAVPILIIVNILWGFTVFLIGLGFLFFDLLIMAIFERRLMNKSFSEIMKGER